MIVVVGSAVEVKVNCKYISRLFQTRNGVNLQL